MLEDFRGEYHHNIDNKGRLSIPKKFAAILSREENGNVVITRGLDRCLWMYPQSQFEKITGQIRTLPMFDPRVQNFQNLFVSGSHDDVLDKTGRILLPKHLLDFALIKKEVVIVGSLYRIQIWSLENWNRNQEQLSVNVNDVASVMASFFPQIEEKKDSESF